MENLKKKLPPMTSLVAFEAVGRLESFAAAATELNVTREAVSRQIRILEEHMGVFLFERDANRIKIGTVGEQFLRVVSPNLWAIASAAAEISGDAPALEEKNIESKELDAFETPVLMVLDDTAENIHQLNGILSGQYRVVGFTDAKEALDYLSASRVDLVLLDIRMPDISGLDVARRIRATAVLESVPIIFVTNLESPEDEVEALEAGGSDFISRPIVPATLKARIKTHIDLSRSKKSIETILQRRVERLARAETFVTSLAAQIEGFQRS